MDLFLKDYENNNDRYVCGKLPILPFKNNEFDLAFVSNFLFLYDNYLDYEFHFQSIIELSRVATEVRIFPISSTRGGISPHIPLLTKSLAEAGYETEVFESSYTFIKVSSETLIVRQRN